MEDNVRDMRDTPDAGEIEEIVTDFVHLKAEITQLDQAISDYLKSKTSF